jgi:hypothetical protein
MSTPKRQAARCSVARTGQRRATPLSRYCRHVSTSELRLGTPDCLLFGRESGRTEFCPETMIQIDVAPGRELRDTAGRQSGDPIKCMRADAYMLKSPKAAPSAFACMPLRRTPYHIARTGSSRSGRRVQPMTWLHPRRCAPCSTPTRASRFSYSASLTITRWRLSVSPCSAGSAPLGAALRLPLPRSHRRSAPAAGASVPMPAALSRPMCAAAEHLR